MSLAMGAVVFAVVWTLGMIAWNWPVEPIQAALFALGGLVAAIAWYVVMGWWMRRRAVAAVRPDPPVR